MKKLLISFLFISYPIFTYSHQEPSANNIVPFPEGTTITYKKDKRGEFYWARFGKGAIFAQPGCTGWSTSSCNWSIKTTALHEHFKLHWKKRSHAQAMLAMKELYTRQEADKQNHWLILAEECKHGGEVSC